MEYGQNFIVQKIKSAHNLHELGRRSKKSVSHNNLNGNQYGSTSNSGSPYRGSPSLNKHEHDPLLQVEEGKAQRSVQSLRHLPPDQAHKVYKFLSSRQGSSRECLTDLADNHSLDGVSGSHNSFSSRPSSPKPIHASQSIRLQVLVWNVGALDVVQGRVPVTFRVTMFWNDDTSLRGVDDFEGLDSNDSVSVGPHRLYEMRGRSKAVPVRGEKDDAAGLSIDVPPISILNVVTFDTIGSPEIALLRADSGLWQWTCMYRATLIQDHWMVDNFPHDEHEICLKLAVLAHRKAEARWDRRIWHLGLATEKDSMGCVRVPHGLVVGNLSIPEFKHDDDLKFSFEPLDIGPGGTQMHERCLAVKLKVQ